MLPRPRLAVVVAALSLFRAASAQATPSSDELVRQARAHEAAHEDDVAVRRYMEALDLDPAAEDAWLGLGALRMRLGEPVEAERVYDAALQRVPLLHRALAGRARALWAQGKHAQAEADLDGYATATEDAAALRELGQWYGTDGRTPAQLATWRRLLAVALDAGDAVAEREARRMVRALVILTDGADPASSPLARDPTRRGLAQIARRGG
ncbi:MAG TPA: tetratricopeptide repeat protein [Polyangiaceae bacterium]|jgi:tetratricopeptide (TPR) repeat protein